MNNVTLVECIELNSFYAPDKCHNGGGYHQPRCTWRFERNGQPYTLVYQDESCGDFGVRYYVELREGHDGSGHCIYDYSVDTVSSEPSERLDKSSEFTKEFYDELVNSELIDKGLPWSIEEEDC